MKLETVLAAKGQAVHIITPGASVRDAVARLAEHNVGALVVVGDSGLPVGILSERDIVRRLATNTATLDLTVGDLMSTTVTTGTLADEVESVFHTMTQRRIRHLPVVEGGRLIGMVSMGDLVKAVLTDYQGTVANLETQLLNS